MTERLCYVSAFFDLEREKWVNFSRSFENYFNYFLPLLKMFKKMNTEQQEYELIIFIDEKHYKTVDTETKGIANVYLIPIDNDFLTQISPLWNRLAREEEIIKSSYYIDLVQKRLKYPEHHNSRYTLINHAKIDFVTYAATMTNSEHFCWIDFGYFGNPINIPRNPLDITRFVKDKITYTLITTLEDSDKNIINVLLTAPERFGGFFFFGNRKAIANYQALYHRIHQELQDINIVDDDQHLALRCYFAQPELFSLYHLGGWHKALCHFQKPFEKNNYKPRIAVCMSGFLRTWLDTKRTFIEQICQNAQIDVFVHTYDLNMYEFTADEQDVIYTEEQIREFFNGINLCDLIVENHKEIMPNVIAQGQRFDYLPNWEALQQESSDKNSSSISIVLRIYDQLRKINACNELRKEYEKKNNVIYDLVMKTRPDVVYFNTPDWSKCQDGKIHCGYGATWGWPEDTVCVTIPEIMDSGYANRFLYLDEIYKNSPPDAGMCAHYTLRRMIEKFNIQIGTPAVNINCFRSKNSFQYYGNYRYKCNLEWLYENVIKHNCSDPIQIENIKKNVLTKRCF